MIDGFLIDFINNFSVLLRPVARNGVSQFVSHRIMANCISKLLVVLPTELIGIDERMTETSKLISFRFPVPSVVPINFIQLGT